jgi:hypothetical protein
MQLFPRIIVSWPQDRRKQFYFRLSCHVCVILMLAESGRAAQADTKLDVLHANMIVIADRKTDGSRPIVQQSTTIVYAPPTIAPAPGPPITHAQPTLEPQTTLSLPPLPPSFSAVAAGSGLAPAQTSQSNFAIPPKQFEGHDMHLVSPTNVDAKYDVEPTLIPTPEIEGVFQTAVLSPIASVASSPTIVKQKHGISGKNHNDSENTIIAFADRVFAFRSMFGGGKSAKTTGPMGSNYSKSTRVANISPSVATEPVIDAMSSVLLSTTGQVSNAALHSQDGPSDPNPSLETFVLPRPAKSRKFNINNATFALSNSLGVGPNPIKKDTVNGTVVYSDFPGMNPVNVSLDGLADGKTYQSNIDPSTLVGTNPLSSNSMVVSSAGEGWSLGSGGGDVPDAGNGLRFFKPVDNHSGTAGVGLYQRLGATNLSLIPGVDTSLETTKNHSLDFALAADSSMRLAQRNVEHGWSTQGFVGWSALSHESQDAFSISRQFKTTSFYQSYSFTMGKESGFAWGQGLSQRIGVNDIDFGSTISNSSGVSNRGFYASFLRPIARDLFSTRWEEEIVGSDGVTSRSMDINSELIVPQHNGTIVSISDSLGGSVGTPFQHDTTLTDSWQLGSIFNLNFGIDRNWNSGQLRLAGGLGIWATPNWKGTILFGPSPESLPGNFQSTIFGFQLVNRFNTTTYATGTVRGMVTIDGEPPAVPVRMQMDNRYTSTDNAGAFEFNRALIGQHDIGFDLTSMPATLNADVMDEKIEVTKGQTTNVTFAAQKVGLVKGKVEVAPDTFGKIDPTAGIGIVVSDGQGHETTTDSTNSFTLGDLPIGADTISLVPSSLPPGFQIVSAPSTTITVAGDMTSVASDRIVFQIAPVTQAVQMTTLTPAKK